LHNNNNNNNNTLELHVPIAVGSLINNYICLQSDLLAFLHTHTYAHCRSMLWNLLQIIQQISLFH